MEGGQARGGGVTGMSVGEGVALMAGVAIAAAGYVWWFNRKSTPTTERQRSSPAISAAPTPTPKQQVKVCKSCGKTESGDRALVRCGRCHKVYYCSRDCQRQDWGRHKPECSSSDSAAAPKKTPPPEPLPAWAQNLRLTSAEYANVKALLKKNDEQFELHLRGGPKPDSVDDIWEGLEPQEMQQLIEDTIWYKEFYKTNDASNVLSLLRRLASVQFWGSSPVAVAFFCLVFSKQSEETLRSWVDQCATELAQDGWFRSAFLTFLRYADTPASRACYQPVLALLSSAVDQLEAQSMLSLTIPDFVARPLHEPLHSPEAVDHMWANYFATGNVALLKKIIKEALPLAAQARVASNPVNAQLLMQTCNFAAVTLVNEGIFDEQVRNVCKSERDALTSGTGQQNLGLMQMLQQIMMQQEGSIQQLATIPAEEVSRMRVEVEGHRPFLERMREIKHRQKVARLKQMPGVRTVPTQFGNALWLPATTDHPEGLLFMTMEGESGAH